MARCQVFSDPYEAVSDVSDGSVLMVAGFGLPGTPDGLVKALIRKGVRRLTCICGPWHASETDAHDVAMLVASGMVERLITAAPTRPSAHIEADRLWRQSGLDVEISAQGTLAERIRAGGAGLGGILLSTGVGTELEDGKEVQVIDGEGYMLEMPLKADFALLRAHIADTLGNLVYRTSQRNWNPIMATAANTTIVEVNEIVEPGGLDPELVVTPGIYVDRIVTARLVHDG